MKKAIYTFIFGDYDGLKEPLIVTPGWDYICFTDAHAPGIGYDGPWQFRPPAFPGHHDAKKWAIQHMILTHKSKELRKYDLTISVGGQIQINCNLDKFITRFRASTDMMMIRHPERACVYDEAEACKALGKDDPDLIDTQMARYRSYGLTRSLGLWATGIIAKRNGDKHYKVKDMCELWWAEIEANTKRDQLALPYALYNSSPFHISELGWWQTFGNNMGADQSFILHRHK